MLLAHDVFFTLHDASAEARARLVAACSKYLSGHDGSVFMSVGLPAPEFNRPVNDHGFDVALHVYFKDKASHDAYQVHPRHQQFLEESQANWKQVRVFDWWVDAPASSIPAAS
jgi:hypothetical protein